MIPAFVRATLVLFFAPLLLVTGQETVQVSPSGEASHVIKARHEVIDFRKPIFDLQTMLDANATLRELLVESISAAKIKSVKLNPEIHAALAWPTTLDEYFAYLEKYVRWVPMQTNVTLWRVSGQHHVEIMNRVCHFYFLVDQPVGPNQELLQHQPGFREWMVAFADAWGSFLDSPDSLTDEIVDTFVKNSPEWELESSLIDSRPMNPSGWLTFNQMFARRLLPGSRPIDSPFDNTVVTSPADCTFRQSFRIGQDGSLSENDSDEQTVTLKRTHTFGYVQELLKGSKYADRFNNGVFAHYFLNTYSYHHFHTPVAGEVVECYPISGEVYLDVEITEDGQLSAPDRAEDGYEFRQARGVIVIDSSKSPFGDVGMVAVIPIGMAQVSSVNMLHLNHTYANKGDEFGFFMFGGSDIVILFEERANARLLMGDQYNRVGSEIVRVISQK